MRKTLSIVALAVVLALQPGIAFALSSGEARSEWLAAQKTRLAEDAKYRQAALTYAAAKTPENEQALIAAGKSTLDAALDEAAAWLGWKKLEAEESPDISDALKSTIAADVATNLGKIAGLRNEVAAVDSRATLGVVFLKMVGSYVGLLTDVARNSGAVWVQVGNALIDRASGYETKLRAAATALPDNADLLKKLDIARSDLDSARAKVEVAEAAYKAVKLPGTPFAKFAEGNGYLRQARQNLLEAQTQLAYVFQLIIAR